MECDDVNAVMVGYEGRVGMLKAVFSPGTDEPAPAPAGKGKWGSKFRAFAKDHNTRIAGGKKRGAK